MEGNRLRDYPDAIDIYRLLREKFLHEDHWIQHRVTWLLTANGFLFAGYGALANLSATSGGAILEGILMFIPLTGATLAILVLAGIGAANSAKRGAVLEWKRLVPCEEARAKFPEIGSVGQWRWLGSLASGGSCVFLAVAWALIWWLQEEG